jgi:hypothetical protein
MPAYLIVFLVLSFVLGAGVLAFIYFGLLRRRDDDPR